ncbi:hypothetical protein DFJ73DRAFT_596864, partial [Zopfochytrium polystomum]
VDVLQWWKESGLELQHTEKAMTKASSKGRLDLLQWWKDSGLELKYTTHAVKRAAIKCRVDMLRWWRGSGPDLDWAAVSFENMSHIRVLDWWES